MEETDTLRQALEKMEHHGYAAVPLLSTEGKYLGTLTDADVEELIGDRKSTRLNSSHVRTSRMPSSA